MMSIGSVWSSMIRGSSIVSIWSSIGGLYQRCRRVFQRCRIVMNGIMNRFGVNFHNWRGMRYHLTETRVTLGEGGSDYSFSDRCGMVGKCMDGSRMDVGSGMNIGSVSVNRCRMDIWSGVFNGSWSVIGTDYRSDGCGKGEGGAKADELE